jgi:hypothetical protein
VIVVMMVAAVIVLVTCAIAWIAIVVVACNFFINEYIVKGEKFLAF